MSANGETAWEPEEPIGGIFEINGEALTIGLGRTGVPA